MDHLYTSGLMLVISGFILNSIKELPRKLLNFILEKLSIQFITDQTQSKEDHFDTLIALFMKQKQIFPIRNFRCTFGGGRRPSDGRYWFFYKGKLANLYIYHKDISTISSVQQHRVDYLSIRFYFANQNIIDQFIEESKELSSFSNTITIQTNGGDYWKYLTTFFIKDLNSVILDSKIKNHIVNYVDNFIKSKDWYISHGIPYRTGILLYGPPGNGKTSLIKALASKFKFNIYILSLKTDSLDDKNLISLFSSISDRTFVVIEDIDSVSDGRNIKDGINISFSGLLNALDGVASSQNVIYIFTTNKYPKLDEALTRPGRIDQQIEISNATQAQAQDYFNFFYNNEYPSLAEEFSRNIKDGQYSMASLQNHLLGYKNNPTEAAKGIK